MLKFLKILVTLVLVGVLIVAVDWASVWVIMSNMSLVWLFVYVLVIFSGIAISAYKWGQIAQFGGFTKERRQYFWWYYSGVFLNNFFPGFLGGDTYRAVKLAGSKDKIAQASATVVLDRVTGLLAFLVLGALAGIVAYLTSLEIVYAMLAAVMFMGLLIVVGVFLLRHWIIQYKYTPKILRKYASIFEIYNRISLVTALIWSTIFALVGVALANYLLFVAIGISLSPILYLALIFPINIAIALPLSIGNIGTKEWVYIVVFALIGVTSEMALAVVIAGRIIQMIISLGAAPLFLRK